MREADSLLADKVRSSVAAQLSQLPKIPAVFSTSALPVFVAVALTSLSVSDGSKVMVIVLFEIHQTKEWLLTELERQNIHLNQIFYGFYQKRRLFIIEKDKVI